jgi:hypothetical protein
VSDGIVGTCSEVERHYVRVQSQPDPGSVRPAAVLQRSLAAVAKREAAGEPYDVTGDFYMSICQDLRLQQIESELTVAAREGFALCAMRARVGAPGQDKGMDMKALSDCFLHLQVLYEKNPATPRQLEFALYRFLMWLGLTAQGASDATAQLNSSLRYACTHTHTHTHTHTRTRARTHTAQFNSSFRYARVSRLFLTCCRSFLMYIWCLMTHHADLRLAYLRYACSNRSIIIYQH